MLFVHRWQVRPRFDLQLVPAWNHVLKVGTRPLLQSHLHWLNPSVPLSIPTNLSWSPSISLHLSPSFIPSIRFPLPLFLPSPPSLSSVSLSFYMYPFRPVIPSLSCSLSKPLPSYSTTDRTAQQIKVPWLKRPCVPYNQLFLQACLMHVPVNEFSAKWNFRHPSSWVAESQK